MSSLVVRLVAVAAAVMVPAAAVGADPPADATLPATATAQAVRLDPPDPVPEPPAVDDWRDGVVAGCEPGASFSRVDTGGEKLISFTFDDGPDRTWTEPIMRAFEARNVRATFFVVGSMVRATPDKVRSMIDRGFEVGNHTMTHSYTHSKIAAEIPALNSLLFQRFEVRTPFFRAPGLASGRLITAAAASAGMCIVRVNIISGDTDLPRRNAAQLCARVTSQLTPGGIVLLHDGGHHKATADGVPCMLDAAISRGYRIVTLAELLSAGPTIR